MLFGPGQLSKDEVMMILRVYWTDKYTRAAAGLRGSNGLQDRLARQFKVKRSTIERIVEMKHNVNRSRYPGIHLGNIQKEVKRRLRQRGIIE